jgi:hypothetical protein
MQPANPRNRLPAIAFGRTRRSLCFLSRPQLNFRTVSWTDGFEISERDQERRIGEGDH